MAELTKEEEEELAYILLGEAGGEGRAGMEAVMHVMMNRSLSGRYPDNVYEVATQGKGSQFNAARTVEAARKSWPASAHKEAVQVIRSVASGTRADPTGGSLHFYANEGPNKIKEPGWFQATATGGTVQIGNHLYAARRSPKKFTVPRVLEVQQGKVRDKPLDPKLRQLLTHVAERLDVQFEVKSGGQIASREPHLKGRPGGWTGSTRHDHGEAADVQMVRRTASGKKQYISFETQSGRQLWSEAVRLSANLGATGIGADVNYMGAQTVHIGYGSAATWGGTKGRGAAPEWLQVAYTAGAKGRSLMALAPTPATMTGRLSALRADVAARTASIPLPRRMPPRSLVADTSEPQVEKPLVPLSGLASRRPTMREMQAIRQVEFNRKAPTPVARIARVAPVSTSRTAQLPSGKTIEIGQTYTVGGVTYIGDVDSTGRGTMRKVDLGILTEAGKPTVAGGVVDSLIRQEVAGGARGAGAAVPGVAGTVAGAAGEVVDAMGNAIRGPVAAITGAVSKIVWVTETVRVRNPAYKSAVKAVPVGQTVMLDRLGIPTGEVGFRSFVERGGAPPEPEFIEQQIVVQREVPVSAAPRPRVLPPPPVRRPIIPESYAPRGSNTIYTNPTKYGATRDERRARAARRERLENFGGGEGSGPSGVPQSLVG